MNEDTTQKQAVQLVNQLDTINTTNPRWYDATNDLSQLIIADINNGQSEISEHGELIVKRRMNAPNRAKPVGLRFNLSEVIEIQDEDAATRPLKYKQCSFVESWHYFAEYSRHKAIRRDLIIEDVAIAFRTADLPTPDVDDLEQWIHDRFREFDENADDGPTPIA